jgi:hypothetical protein
MDAVYIAIVEDGADFNRQMCELAFSEHMAANSWACQRRDELREERRQQGETDPAFIEAIDCRIREVEFLS